MPLLYVSGEEAAKLGYVNPGTDRRYGGTLGRLAGRVQTALSFKSNTLPIKSLELINGNVWLETAIAPRGRQHISIAVKRGKRWATLRYGWRYDPNWGDSGTLGYNPNPEIVGGYVFDIVLKLQAPISFIEGVA